jgi:hypothetical protein
MSSPARPHPTRRLACRTMLATLATAWLAISAGFADDMPATTAAPVSYPVQTWTLPDLTIQGAPSSGLREEERIGSYGQPRWTSHRRFPTARVYVRPEGEIDVELWNRTKVPKDGPNEWIQQAEIEIGLPNRFQFDIYAITRHKEGEDYYNDLALELRYALADWGDLPGNPTLYGEWIFKEDASDVFEGKLLLGGELASRWHWATNFVWEQEVDEARETVLELTNGLSYTVMDEKLSIGLEAKAEIANEKGERSGWGEDIRIGPSLQWRPSQRSHVDIAPLFGVTDDSKRADIYVVVGFEF